MQRPITTTELDTKLPLYPEEDLKTLLVASGQFLPWLTVERGAYIGLVLLALVLRLLNLGGHPLSDAEAGQALVGWRIFQGQPVEQSGYSPLMATLNLLSFFIWGASHYSARLASTLLGVALVALPYGLRGHLGRKGALIATALLAISPTTIYFSRIVNGEIGAVVGGLALAVGLFGWIDSLGRTDTSRLHPPMSSLFLAGGGLVMLLTSAPVAYSILVLLLGFLLLAATVGDRRYAATAREGLAALRKQLMGWGETGLVLLLALLVLASAFLFNMGGLAATADLLTTWLLNFAPLTAQPGAYPAVFLLTFYEPLILLAGLFGLSLGLLRRRMIDLFLAWWFFGGIGINLLQSGRTNGAVLVALVPLTLLAGLALGRLWDSLRGEGSWAKEGMLVIIGVIISGYAAISLLTYSLSGGRTFWLPVAALALFAGIVALFWFWYDGASALRGAASVGLIVLAVFSVAIGFRLNFTFTGILGGGEGVVSPRQPLAGSPAGEGLADLLVTLKQLSSGQTGDAYLVHIVADRRVGPAVEWQLRDYKNVIWVDNIEIWSVTGSSEFAGGLGRDSAALLAPATVQLSLQESFVGQDFAVRAFWSPAGLSGQQLIRWIMMRTAPTLADYERVVLWVKQPQAVEAEEGRIFGITSGESIR